MRSREPLAGEAAVALLFALGGWAVAAAVFSLTLWTGTLRTAFAVHGVTMPILFLLVALVYFARSNALPPLRAAVLFATVAAVLEIGSAGLLPSRSYNAVTSVAGTWLPVFFVLVVTWLTGIGALEACDRIKPSS